MQHGDIQPHAIQHQQHHVACEEEQHKGIACLCLMLLQPLLEGLATAIPAPPAPSCTAAANCLGALEGEEVWVNVQRQADIQGPKEGGAGKGRRGGVWGGGVGRVWRGRRGQEGRGREGGRRGGGGGEGRAGGRGGEREEGTVVARCVTG